MGQSGIGQQGEDFLNLSNPDNPWGCTKGAGVSTGRVLPEIELRGGGGLGMDLGVVVGGMCIPAGTLTQ